MPLATLISATKPPSGPTKDVILSPEGKKRYFVVHGGLFSKDGVTLEDIRKLDRIGKQPGTEGLMCEVRRNAHRGKSCLLNLASCYGPTRKHNQAEGRASG